MDIDVSKFQDIIKKATLNYTIPSVQVKIDNERIVSKMRSTSNNVVVVLDLPNEGVISGVPDTIELNFTDPHVRIKPYLSLIDNNIVSVLIDDEKLVIKDGKHKTNLFTCMSSSVTVFTGNMPVITPFHEISLTDEIKECFDKIIRIGGTFDRVYFSVRNKKFLVETTDKTNRFSNGINFELGSVNSPNLDICLSYKNFNALLKVINDNIVDFSVVFTYLEDTKSGMVRFGKNDGTENYFLLSQQENT